MLIQSIAVGAAPAIDLRQTVHFCLSTANQIVFWILRRVRFWWATETESPIFQQQHQTHGCNRGILRHRIWWILKGLATKGVSNIAFFSKLVIHFYAPLKICACKVQPGLRICAYMQNLCASAYAIASTLEPLELQLGMFWQEWHLPQKFSLRTLKYWCSFIVLLPRFHAKVGGESRALWNEDECGNMLRMLIKLVCCFTQRWHRLSGLGYGFLICVFLFKV